MKFGNEFVLMGKNDNLKTPCYFTEYIHRRVNRHDKNFLCLIQGQTGSGKSFAAMRICQVLDPEFGVDRIVFSVEEFMQLLNNSDKYGLKKGSVILFDECGVGMPARQFQQMTNKLFNYCLQTFRHKNFIVFFTTPLLEMLDKQARRLLHCIMMTNGIDFANKQSKLKPYFLVQDLLTGDFRPKSFRKYDNTIKRTLRVSELRINMPTLELVEAYDRKKNYFTKSLNQMIMTKIKGKEATTMKGKEIELMQNSPKGAISSGRDITPTLKVGTAIPSAGFPKRRFN